ncbi:hypothetical protein MKW94_014348 [Papaver nudicaule]|uniref:Aluminum-activated malate transporter n=1 Tax=Papaver nudicaule TaxID=74823 RepID=A0AA42AYD8_PAPNU|nr:hypothetical protein [Papaver nudicaule]
MMMIENILRVGREDPTKLIHALKVGMALTLASMLYLVGPLYSGIGENAVWGVITVVVVFEATVGATLSKGVNRLIGTLCAGSLAFLLICVVDKSGRTSSAIFIGIVVFLTGTAATYLRFIPHIKKTYDYSFVVFLITFNLLAASSFRTNHVIEVTLERICTVAIGCGICLVMTLVFPDWSGSEFHNSTASKLDFLAESIDACVNKYFEDSENIEESSDDVDHIQRVYESILDSKATDDTLALHASWEPMHSTYRYKYPWEEYVRLGSVLRQFGFTVVALHACLQSQDQTPRAFPDSLKDSSTRFVKEISGTLKELADSIRDKRLLAPTLVSGHHGALKDLDDAVKSQPQSLKISEAFMALLVGMAAKLDKVIEQAENLGQRSRFNQYIPDTIEIIIVADDENRTE